MGRRIRTDRGTRHAWRNRRTTLQNSCTSAQRGRDTEQACISYPLLRYRCSPLHPSPSPWRADRSPFDKKYLSLPPPTFLHRLPIQVYIPCKAEPQARLVVRGQREGDREQMPSSATLSLPFTERWGSTDERERENEVGPPAAPAAKQRKGIRRGDRCAARLASSTALANSAR